MAGANEVSGYALANICLANRFFHQRICRRKVPPQIWILSLNNVIGAGIIELDKFGYGFANELEREYMTHIQESVQ